MATLVHTTRLPEVLPIFPLPGALLLPRGRLPLNIFEPRYLRMVLEALGHSRMLGMVQPLRAASDPIPDDAPLFQVGCAGRITAFAEADDERCLITLVGVTRFRIAAELPLQGGGYRRIAADASSFLNDIAADPGPIAVRDQLLAGAKRLFTSRGFELDWRALAAAPDEPMVTALAMIAPLDVAEKQALLEARTLADRAAMLTTMIEMANRSHAGPNTQPN